MSKGIDYGMGLANIDSKTGCRYGVISIRSLHEWIYEELDPYYGEPTCPKCGSELVESATKDFRCENCLSIAVEDGRIDPDADGADNEYTYWSDQVYSEECLGQTLDDGTYKAHDAFDQSCLFVTESPYYTFAAYCSPCAPGAGNLDSPCEDGAKTLCFGHEKFEGGKAPYPVYRVENDELVQPEENADA